MRKSVEVQFWEPFTVDMGEVRMAFGHVWHVPGIVYPELSIKRPLHNVIGMGGFAVTHHLASLREKNKDLFDDSSSATHYRHAFVWSTGEHAMTDVWTHVFPSDEDIDPEDVATACPQSSVQVFRDMHPLKSDELPVASGNTLYVLGKEEEYRRKLEDRSSLDAKVKSFAAFAIRDSGHMPDFPEGFIRYARHKRR